MSHTATETSVPTETLDIVRRLRELTQDGRLVWEISRPSFQTHAAAVSLASGQWKLIWNHADDTVHVYVWDGEGTSVFSFSVGSADPYFGEFKELYEAANRHNRKRIADTVLSKMREELAAR